MTTSAPALPACAETRSYEPVAPWWHTVLLIVALVAYAIVASRPEHLAKIAALPDRTVKYLEASGMEIGVVLYTWFGLARRGVHINEIIGGKWQRFSDFLIDVATAILFWMAVIVALLLLAPLLHSNSIALIRLMGPRNGHELLAWSLCAVTAGFCEELIFRGYLQRQFLSLVGAAWAAILLQALLFGFVHLYQGWNHVIAIVVYGSLFGILAHLRKSLRPGMMQHFGEDLIFGLAAFVAFKRRII
jgi:CAAX protease family protein